MAAIVRVKRKLNEPAADSIVLLCKRQKVAQDQEEKQDEIKSVFKFAGTVSSSEQTVSNCVKQAITKEKLEKEYRRLNVCSSSKERAHKTRAIGLDARYNIVSSKRGLCLTSLNVTTQSDSTDEAASNETLGEENDEENKKVFCLYEVEKDCLQPSSAKTLDSEETILCNGVPMICEKVTTAADNKPDDYVYDLYYMNSAQFPFRSLENILAIEAYREELIYEDHGSDSDDPYDNEDDENAENNWRNDYPDEDPHLIDPLPRAYDQYFTYDDARFDDGFNNEADDTDPLEYRFTDGLNLNDSDEESSAEMNPRVYAETFRRLRDD